MGVYQYLHKEFSDYEDYKTLASDNLLWLQSVELHSEAGYQKYLEKFPQGIFSLQAQKNYDALRSSRIGTERKKADERKLIQLRSEMEDSWKKQESLQPFMTALFFIEKLVFWINIPWMVFWLVGMLIFGVMEYADEQMTLLEVIFKIPIIMIVAPVVFGIFPALVATFILKWLFLKLAHKFFTEEWEDFSHSLERKSIMRICFIPYFHWAYISRILKIDKLFDKDIGIVASFDKKNHFSRDIKKPDFGLLTKINSISGKIYYDGSGHLYIGKLFRYYFYLPLSTL